MSSAQGDVDLLTGFDSVPQAGEDMGTEEDSAPANSSGVGNSFNYQEFLSKMRNPLAYGACAAATASVCVCVCVRV